MTTLAKIEGVGESYADRLKEAGILSAEDLLNEGATPVGRKELAGKVGTSEKMILQWVNVADFFRINGISREYAELLEAAGVNAVPDLGKRNPNHLFAKLLAVNEEKKQVRRMPTLAQVTSWVEQARKMPRVVIN